MSLDYDIIISKIDTFEEYKLKDDNISVCSSSSVNNCAEILSNTYKKKSKKKYFPEPIIIIPKCIQQNYIKKVSEWYQDNRKDINYIFTNIIDIFYSNDIHFTHSEEYIYDKFVELMYKNNTQVNSIYNKNTISSNNDIHYNDFMEFNDIYGNHIETDILKIFSNLKDQTYILQNIISSIIENFFMSFVDMLDHIYILSGDEDGEYITEEDYQ